MSSFLVHTAEDYDGPMFVSVNNLEELLAALEESGMPADAVDVLGRLMREEEFEFEDLDITVEFVPFEELMNSLNHD